MSRKTRKNLKREIQPELKYNSIILMKFINKVMLDGKKRKAENIVYKALENLENKIEENALEGFLKVIASVSPKMEVKSRRVGGATYQVPMQVPKERAITLAMRWIINYAKSRKGNTMADRLASELIAASNNDGSSVKKKEDTHRMAEANTAFSHFR